MWILENLALSISGHRFDHYGRIHFVEQRSLCDNLRAPLEKTGVAECELKSWLNVPGCDYDKCDLKVKYDFKESDPLVDSLQCRGK